MKEGDRDEREKERMRYFFEIKERREKDFFEMRERERMRYFFQNLIERGESVNPSVIIFFCSNCY